MKPALSQYATVADYQTARQAWIVKAHILAEKVNVRAEEQYGIQDGGDLCFNLQESGVIDPEMHEDEATRIVAMHIQQA